MAYLPDFIYTAYHYGFPALSAPCAAIPSLSAFGEIMSLGEYLLLLFLLRGLCYLCLGMTIFAVSVMLRDTMKTMVFCTLLIVFPLLIHLAGIEKDRCHILQYVSFRKYVPGLCKSRICAADPDSAGIRGRGVQSSENVCLPKAVSRCPSYSVAFWVSLGYAV